MEVLRKKDFEKLSQDEKREIIKVIGQLRWKRPANRSHRFRSGNGEQIDFRKTLRKNAGLGGELMEWRFRKRKPKPFPIVILADISGSMEIYTRILLHFFYSLMKIGNGHVEIFLFGTKLTRISRQLRIPNVDHAIQAITELIKDWSGGTRIGQAIRTYNYDWARHSSGKRPYTILISDGWDRGQPDLLKRELSRLSRYSNRLLWLNPLLETDNYAPLTKGMKTSLPYIDQLLPAHNLDSLTSLFNYLGNIKSTSSLPTYSASPVRI